MILEFEWDVSDAMAMFHSYLSFGSDPSAALMDLGKYIEGKIDEGFAGEHTPYGIPWAPLKPSTVRWRNKHGGPGNGILDHTGTLRGSFEAVLEGNNTVVVGSDVAYANYQSRFAAKGSSGTGSHGRSIPWGDKPARMMIPPRMPSTWEGGAIAILEGHLTLVGRGFRRIRKWFGGWF